MISFKEYLNQKTLNEDINKDYEDIKNDPAKNLILKWVNKNGKKTRFTGLNNKEKQEVFDEINKEIEEVNKEIEKKNKEIEKSNKETGDNKELLKLGKKYENVKELNSDFENIEKIISNKSFNSFGDIDKADTNNFKKLFFQSILNEKDSIAKLNGNKVRQVVDCFSSSNKNGDKKIDKEEFVNAVKKIQTKFKGNLEVPAIILWLLYLKQNSIEKNVKIFNNNSSELPSGSETIAYLKDKDNFYVDADGKKLNSNFEDLNLVFKSFENLQIDKSVLKNFKNINSSKSFLNKNIDEVKDEIKGNFTPKTQAQKDAEKTEDELRQTQNDINDTQARIDAEDEKIKKIEDGYKSPTEETGDPTKGNWFSLNVDLPEPGDNNELNNFISSVEKAVDSELKKIIDEVKSYQIKKKKNDLEDDETQKEDIVLKIIKQKGFKILKEDSVAGLDSGDEEIDEWLNANNEEIRRIISKYSTKLKKINDKLEASDNYSKSRGLRLNFKFMLTDFGKEINSSLLDLKEGIRKKVRNLRNKSWDADLSSHKTLEQKGQEDLNVKKIVDFLKETNKNDAHAIAKYMFINLLAKNSDSEKVYEMLNDKSFSSPTEWSKYVYIGDDKVIYALDKNSVKQDNFFRNILPGVKVLNCGMAKKYRNPKELLSSIGINISDLTVDVLKRIKKALKDNLSNLSNEANEYLESANKLRGDIAPRASVVTEGFFGNAAEFLKNKKQDAVDYLKGKRQVKADDSIVNSFNTINKKEEQDKENKANTEIEQLKSKRGKMGDSIDDVYQNSINKGIDNDIIKSTFDKLTNSMCTNLQIDANKFEPDGHGVEDIPTRQIFKGFVFIKYNDKAFFTTPDRLEKIKNELKTVMKQQNSDKKNYDKAQNAANNTYNANDIENNGKAENLGATDGMSSVVTSGAADSTYGDGYSYNKKADAIKKKLNCTTYTYSPNPKMKIVRRTFD